MSLFLIAVISGLAVGSVYGLIAISYGTIYQSSGVFNVAQGDLLVVGILVSYFAVEVWNLPSIVVLLLIIVVVVALSLIEERVAVRPILKRMKPGGITWFISTLAFGLVLSAIALLIYGPQPVRPIASAFGAEAWRIGDLVISPKYVAALVVLIVVTAGLEVFYRRSLLGVAMRAVAADREVANLRGISPQRITRTAFIIAGIVTGLGAFVLAPIVSADITVGLIYALKGFVAMAIGGFGSLKGAAIGGLLLGVSEQLLSLYWTSNYEVLAGLVLLIVVLMIRPTGIFGRPALREV
ncbi:branched-chain amino acid ABC transporter permease [Microbacterium sp. A588]